LAQGGGAATRLAPYPAMQTWTNANNEHLKHGYGTTDAVK